MRADEFEDGSRTVGALVGEVLDVLRVGGFQVTLDLSGGHHVHLEQAISVNEQTAAAPAELGGLALLLPLLHREVTSARIEAPGRLVLEFGDLAFACSHHEKYEAWAYNGRNGATIVCQPGGGLAIWAGR